MDWIFNMTGPELQRFQRFQQKLRMENKRQENQVKPPLYASDVKMTTDFTFASFTPFEQIGDSGHLLLAKCKSDRSQRYIIKHEYTDCAANEFVYTKLAQAMGFKMPNAVLFQISENEKRKHFKSEYILGTSFLDVVLKDPSYEQIRENALNWEDFFHFKAMFDMFLESDGFETPIAKDGYLYRIDTSASFNLPIYVFDFGGINQEFRCMNPKEYFVKYINQISYDDLWQCIDFNSSLERLIQTYDADGKRPYMETFSLIQDIHSDYIDDFLNTLCYFYPDFIGDYYKQFILALQKRSEIFLKERKLR